MAETITCPKCRATFEVSTALTAQIRDELRLEFDAESRKRDREFVEQKQALREREAAIAEARLSLETEISSRVTLEKQRLKQEAEFAAHESVALALRDLETQLTETKQKLGEAQQAELQLRKDRRELEQQKQELELVVTRTLDQERAKIRQEAKRQADDEHRLHEADKDKLVADLRRQIDELKRKSEQGSQQAQGEVMELDLEELLKIHFPFDTFDPVPVGVHGGDVFHRVYDANGLFCGSILWESKRTKAWNDAWLPKLRDDQRAARAHVAVLLTAEMPNGMATFGCIDSVWITSRSCLLGLAAALRAGMIEIGRVKRSVDGRQTKVELLYNYVSSGEFRNRIEGLVEAYATLKEDLEAERRSMQRLWAKREKQLDRALANSAGLYGDVGGILGSILPQIPKLDLALIAAETESLPLEDAGLRPEESPF